MNFKGSIGNFSREIKILVATYLVITSIGFISALQFVNVTTDGGQPQGIEENYLGNEDDLEAEALKFAKSEKQILNIVHAHMLSMGMLFFILALLVATTPIEGGFRRLLLFEPLISVFLTFGGIYFLTKGLLWMKYVVMASGILMTLSYIISVGVVFYFILQKVKSED